MPKNKDIMLGYTRNKEPFTAKDDISCTAIIVRDRDDWYFNPTRKVRFERGNSLQQSGPYNDGTICSFYETDLGFHSFYNPCMEAYVFGKDEMGRYLNDDHDMVMPVCGYIPKGAPLLVDSSFSQVATTKFVQTNDDFVDKGWFGVMAESRKILAGYVAERILPAKNAEFVLEDGKSTMSLAEYTRISKDSSRPKAIGISLRNDEHAYVGTMSVEEFVQVNENWYDYIGMKQYADCKYENGKVATFEDSDYKPCMDFLKSMEAPDGFEWAVPSDVDLLEMHKLLPEVNAALALLGKRTVWLCEEYLVRFGNDGFSMLVPLKFDYGKMRFESFSSMVRLRPFLRNE